MSLCCELHLFSDGRCSVVFVTGVSVMNEKWICKYAFRFVAEVSLGRLGVDRHRMEAVGDVTGQILYVHRRICWIGA